MSAQAPISQNVSRSWPGLSSVPLAAIIQKLIISMSTIYHSFLCATALALASFVHAEPSLDELVVTSSPLGGSLNEQAQPVSILTGEKLKLQLQPSIGETLAGEPGISSTYYGPAASRPVIRGFDGERIKILQNGTATLDASAASVDHAVTVQPINIDHIEVVRGPATLLYGTSAVGGIVNVIDDRIPLQLLSVPLTGTVDTRYNSMGGERAASALVEGAAGPVAFHLDGYKRNAHNIDIPGFARSERLRKTSPLADGDVEVRGELPNSAIDEQGGSLGASTIWDSGYMGGSYSQDDSNYGTVAEPEVTIGMRQRRFDFAGALDQPFAAIASIKYKLAVSDYQHIEYEGSTPGTKFENEGYDGRIDLKQTQVGRLNGAFGFQTQKSDFSALGEEAFLPPTETLTHSGFVFEQLDCDPLTVEAGARVDFTSVHADANPAFGPSRRREFDTYGLSFGAIYRLSSSYTAALSTSYTQRAPNQQELFANGPHVATLAFEIGDPNLQPEQSTGIDFTVRKTDGRFTGSASVFYNHFDDYIAQTPSGIFVNGGDLQIYRYRAVEAAYAGGELQATWPIRMNSTPTATRWSAPASATSGLSDLSREPFF